MLRVRAQLVYNQADEPAFRNCQSATEGKSARSDFESEGNVAGTAAELPADCRNMGGTVARN